MENVRTFKFSAFVGDYTYDLFEVTVDEKDQGVLRFLDEDPKYDPEKNPDLQPDDEPKKDK